MNVDDFDLDIGGDRPRAARDAYEDAAVRFACRILGLPQLPRRIAREHEERTDGAGCNFALFEEISGFPVRLRVGRLHQVRFLALPDLFNRPERTPIGEALHRLAAELDPREAPIGVVFRWAGTRDAAGVQKTIKGGKFMVVHTVPAHEPSPGVCVHMPMTLTTRRQVATLEHLESLLGRYAGWEPAETNT